MYHLILIIFVILECKNVFILLFLILMYDFMSLYEDFFLDLIRIIIFILINH